MVGTAGPAEPPPPTKLSLRERTVRSAHALQQSVEQWRVKNQTECPTADRLHAEKALPPEASTTDAWGGPFKVICEDESTTIVSLGPDRREGTEDDLRVGPDAASGSHAVAPAPATTAAPPAATPSGGLGPFGALPNGMLTVSAVQTVLGARSSALRRTVNIPFHFVRK